MAVAASVLSKEERRNYVTSRVDPITHSGCMVALVIDTDLGYFNVLVISSELLIGGRLYFRNTPVHPWST